MSPTIRPATLTDLDLLEQLERASFPDHWTRESLHTSLNESGYLILLADTLGFLLGWSVGDEAEIARLGVFNQARGQGIGSALVGYALKAFHTRGVRSVFLEVREDNATARRLYLRAGFKEIAQRRAYYSDGTNAIVMRLSCDQETD